MIDSTIIQTIEAQEREATRAISIIVDAYNQLPGGHEVHDMHSLRNRAVSALDQIERAAASAIRDLNQLPLPGNPGH